jgi:hypothetical protein
MSKTTIEQAVANGDPIKALNWRQPFASLMLPPYNKVETRTWNTHVRGLVLIVASIKPYDHHEIGHLMGFANREDVYRQAGHDGFINGCALGIGRLVDCRKLRKDDKHFLLWEDGMEERFAHIYEDVHPIEPFAFKGGQKWKIVTDDTRKQIKLS